MVVVEVVAVLDGEEEIHSIIINLNMETGILEVLQRILEMVLIVGQWKVKTLHNSIIILLHQ